MFKTLHVFWDETNERRIVNFRYFLFIMFGLVGCFGLAGCAKLSDSGIHIEGVKNNMMASTSQQDKAFWATHLLYASSTLIDFDNLPDNTEIRALFESNHLELVFKNYDILAQLPNEVLFGDELQSLGTIFRKKGQTEEIIVAMRGTENINDVVADIKAAVTTDFIPMNTEEVGFNPEIRVPKGFFIAYESNRDALIQAIEKFNPQKLVVLGHSLGAAKAAYLAYEISLASKPYDVSSLVVVASPRPGNAVFMRELTMVLKTDPLHVLNTKDVVPKLPPYLKGNRGYSRQNSLRLCFLGRHSLITKIKANHTISSYHEVMRRLVDVSLPNDSETRDCGFIARTISKIF
jgi:hypothetical protein